MKSCRALKFEEAPTIIDEPKLQDGMDTEWSTDLVAEQIDKYLKAKKGEGDKSRINMIVSFD